MFSTTVRRFLIVLFVSVCTTAFVWSVRSPEPEVESEPEVQPVQCSESEVVPVVCYSEPAVEVEENPAPVESRYGSVAAAISQEERGLMALTVYHESRGEPRDGQRAVAETILNRVLSDKFPDTVKEVIYQDGQFSCAGALLSEAIREPGALASCFDVVDEVLSEMEYAIPAHYCFFSTGRPKTSNYIQIGHHYFR